MLNALGARERIACGSARGSLLCGGGEGAVGGAVHPGRGVFRFPQGLTV